MKLLLPALCAISLLPLQAQPPPALTPPSGRFPGFPANLFSQPTSFMALRSEAPFRAVVEKKVVSAESFTITLKSATTTRTFNESPPSADVLKVLEHLVAGKEYDFPKVFDDALGKQAARPTANPAPRRTVPPEPFGNFIGLLDLPTTAPFRARVTSKKVTDALVAIDLQTTDGRTFTTQQAGSQNAVEARRIASLLKEGVTYEFPYDVQPPTPGKKPAQEGGVLAPSAEMKELEGFIGEWEMPMQTDPSRKVIATYLWKKDGQGMWKEIRGEPKEGQKIDGAWLITYDAARKCYVETTVKTNIQPRETELRWDAVTRTLNLRTTSAYPEPGTVQTGTRRLGPDDRMEWTFRSLTPEGRPAGENAGFYTRVKR